MRKSHLLKIFIIAILTIGLIIPNCYAAGAASLSVSKTTAQAGDTVEVYINLGIESIAYDLNISVNDDSLIKTKEMTSDVGQGTIKRIYLIQIASAEERTVYQPGTRLAVLKYTLAENITENKTLTVTVSGDVAGKSSSEKNAYNESISINVTPKTADSNQGANTNNNQGTDTNNNQGTDNNNQGTKEETKTTEDKKEDTKTTETTNKTETTTGSTAEENVKTIKIGFDDETSSKSESKTTQKTQTTTKSTNSTSNTESPKKLPKTGKGASYALLFAGVLVIAIAGTEVYRRNK